MTGWAPAMISPWSEVYCRYRKDAINFRGVVLGKGCQGEIYAGPKRDEVGSSRLWGSRRREYPHRSEGLRATAPTFPSSPLWDMEGNQPKVEEMWRSPFEQDICPARHGYLWQCLRRDRLRCRLSMGRDLVQDERLFVIKFDLVQELHLKQHTQNQHALQARTHSQT
jgi:hypothetical protein